ncbi:MAG: hypothetical protein ACKPKO_09610, partial [Candidatus Fonsibacter sp.]
MGGVSKNDISNNISDEQGRYRLRSVIVKMVRVLIISYTIVCVVSFTMSISNQDNQVFGLCKQCPCATITDNTFNHQTIIMDLK